MNDVLILEDLAIRTPERMLVDGVSLRLVRGEVTALIGPSGAGKSLCAKAAMGVIDVRPGLVRGSLRLPQHAPGDLFADVVGGDARAHRRLFKTMQPLRGRVLTYAPQSAASALNPGRTLGWQLAMAVRRREVRVPDETATIRDLLEEVGLDAADARALPQELSGGMAQRAALAVALAPAPPIVIADEPETGLDPVTRRNIVELMQGLAADRDTALWLISHNHEIVERIAATVVDLGAR
ncbi:MAG: ATP-binding cassette domain-containing protein [Myxococcota bacterium]